MLIETRTEDISSEEIESLFVETKLDRENLSFLKSSTPGLLVGSRGTGKTMLLKMVESELDKEFTENKNLAVFVSFSKALLVNPLDEIYYFRQWMLSKVLFSLKRKLKKLNVLVPSGIFKEYFNISTEENLSERVDKLIKIFEESWYKKQSDIICHANEVIGLEESNAITDVDYFKALIEDVCNQCGIKKIIILFDEACHNFIPIQQREFFTLFRDLRSNYICCKAAVYPGISSYGTVQKFHDVTVKKVERDLTSHDYVGKMREIVRNQVSDTFYNILESNGDYFNALIYASTGNPRLLLKSINLASEGLRSLKKSNVISTIKEFYRTNIWNEHTKLAEMYEGHKDLIEWGRTFMEDEVLKSTWEKNKKIFTDSDKSQTIFFAVHKDAPPAVKQAINILEYLGIVSLHTEGTKVRRELFDRYQVNFGVVLSSEPSTKELPIDPISRYKEIINGLSIKLFTDYGKSSPSYANSEKLLFKEATIDVNYILKKIMDKSVSELDLTDFLIDKVKSIGIETIRDILTKEEKNLQQAYGIGPVKARRIFKTAYNATIEFISG